MKFAEVVQTADWKAEKHVPVIVAPDSVKAGEKFVVEVSVGKGWQAKLKILRLVRFWNTFSAMRTGISTPSKRTRLKLRI